MKKRPWILYSTLFLLILFAVLYLVQSQNHLNTPSSKNLTKVVLGTDWFAQAEHGGFYQAIADGTYQKYGLDVHIKMVGPQVNGMTLLLSKDVDFFMPPSFVMIAAAQKKLPVVSLAAVFQKDLSILMTHPDVGHDSLASLKGQPIFISPPTAAAIWGFLVGKYGYTDDQKRAYGNSLTPFLKDKEAIQEGLLTSEPFTVEKQGHFKPVSLLLSDEGFSAYGELITCRQDYLKDHPDVARAFTKASLEGWKHYLENPTLGNVLIKKDNPQMKDDLIAYAVHKLKSEEVITGGDAKTLGLGAMTDARWSHFYDMLVKSEAMPAGVDIKSVYVLDSEMWL
jgi:NitT/TauT family transport system substrate-binding protein